MHIRFFMANRGSSNFNMGNLLVWLLTAAVDCYAVWHRPINRWFSSGPGRVVGIVLLAGALLYGAVLVFVAVSGYTNSATGQEQAIVVLGAGAHPPPMGRRAMAQVAAELADCAIVTTDNPRWEPVEDICRSITQALGRQIPWEVIYDRREAIFRALDLAQPGDMVALLGKGHEGYIETCGLRLPFSEWAVLEEYFYKNP